MPRVRTHPPSPILKAAREAICQMLIRRKPQIPQKQLRLLADQYILTAARELRNLTERPRRLPSRNTLLRMVPEPDQPNDSGQTSDSSEDLPDDALDDIPEYDAVNEAAASKPSTPSAEEAETADSSNESGLNYSSLGHQNLQTLIAACEYVEAQREAESKCLQTFPDITNGY